jgi:hypothetical protein
MQATAGLKQYFILLAFPASLIYGKILLGGKTKTN